MLIDQFFSKYDIETGYANKDASEKCSQCLGSDKSLARLSSCLPCDFHKALTSCSCNTL